MAAQSVSSISQLLHSSGCYATQPNHPSLKNGMFLVDFVGLYCKSNRTRRKLGASVNRPSNVRHRQSVASRRRTSSVEAVLDLERSEVALDQSRGGSDLEPKVRIVFIFIIF